MKITEVRSQDWEALCQRVSDLRQESLLTIEVLHQDGRKDQVACDVLFRGMRLDQTDACNDRILIEAGGAAANPVTHVIMQPIHIRLRPSKDGSFNPMQIDSEDGTTLLTFHPALRPDLFQGLNLD